MNERRKLHIPFLLVTDLGFHSECRARTRQKWADAGQDGLDEEEEEEDEKSEKSKSEFLWIHGIHRDTEHL